jgi:hypothetical protein
MGSRLKSVLKMLLCCEVMKITPEVEEFGSVLAN